MPQEAYGGEADFKGRNGSVYNLLSSRNVSLNALFTHETFIAPYSKLVVHGSWLKAVYVTLRGASDATLRVQYDAVGRPQSARVALQPAGMQHDSKTFKLLKGQAMIKEGVHLMLKKNVLTLRHPLWRIQVLAAVGAPHPGVARLDVKIQPVYAVDNDAVAPQ
jgi:hypothetical protein